MPTSRIVLLKMWHSCICDALIILYDVVLLHNISLLEHHEHIYMVDNNMHKLNIIVMFNLMFINYVI